MKQLEVGLGERSYPIIIDEGLLLGLGSDLKKRQIAKRYIVISDTTVAGLYGDKVTSSLSAAGFTPELVTFPAGEASKNLSTIAELSSKLAQLGVDRQDCLVALGGGVVGDITGFLAASYMRGIAFVQVPTTMLAQVDSSVGGKTGVDIPEGKNLVGAFYQPRCVYIDPNVLQSLPAEELLNGLAEVIKYGVIYDQEFFEYLAKNRQEIVALNLSFIEAIIEKSCAIKAEVVAQDEREGGLRRILNFGHTIGHAVEADSNYTLAHGMCVAIGMVAACEMAAAKDMFTKADASKVRTLIKDYNLPVGIPQTADRKKLKFYLKTDKKTVGGIPFFVLPTAIGKVVITDDVTEALIDTILSAKPE